jgi:hypothetical protein
LPGDSAADKAGVGPAEREPAPPAAAAAAPEGPELAGAAAAAAEAPPGDLPGPQLLQRAGDGSAPSCQGWRLVVTGHSLGAGEIGWLQLATCQLGLRLQGGPGAAAGVHRPFHLHPSTCPRCPTAATCAGAAALVAAKLRERWGGQVCCWAYSPPGGLLSPGLSAALAPFVTSLALGKDLVARWGRGGCWRCECPDGPVPRAPRCRLPQIAAHPGPHPLPALHPAPHTPPPRPAGCRW